LGNCRNRKGFVRPARQRNRGTTNIGATAPRGSYSMTMTQASIGERQAALERFVRRVDEVSSLPDVAARVIQVVNNPETSVTDLRAVVESDASLVARLLRTVNSAAYGMRTRIDSIHRAISLLGFSTIKNLAVTASVAQLFRDKTPIGHYSRPALWKHLVSVAVAARMISGRCRISQFDEAYMCGLLHDIGLILIDQHQHPKFVEIMQGLTPETQTSELELQVLGFDHAQVGAAVGEKWGFPACVVDAIRHHHDSSRAGEEHRQIVHAVEIANFLCTRKGFSSTGLQNLRVPNPETFAALSIGRDGLKVLFEDLDQELEKSRELMEL